METSHNTQASENEIDLRELLKIFLEGKLIIFSITSIISIIALVYSLSLPNIYQSSAILSPVGESSGGSMNQIMKNYGGLAGLAGINLSSGDSGSNSVKSLEKLKTLSFFENNILPNIFLPDLMAVESWNNDSNKVIYDKEIYDEVSKTWANVGKIPSIQESFESFEEHLYVYQDPDTRFVTISVKHQSPFIAQSWTDLIVNQLNTYFRIKDKQEAQTAMDYLNIQMSQTSFTEIKQVIAQLLQQKMQQLTLIEANPFYVFDYIDPPAVMEKKAEPSRLLICIIGFLLGGILGCLIVFIRHFSEDKDLKI